MFFDAKLKKCFNPSYFESVQKIDVILPYDFK
jgi:hypothetical protein